MEGGQRLGQSGQRRAQHLGRARAAGRPPSPSQVPLVHRYTPDIARQTQDWPGGSICSRRSERLPIPPMPVQVKGSATGPTSPPSSPGPPGVSRFRARLACQHSGLGRPRRCDLLTARPAHSLPFSARMQRPTPTARAWLAGLATLGSARHRAPRPAAGGEGLARAAPFSSSPTPADEPSPPLLPVQARLSKFSMMPPAASPPTSAPKSQSAWPPPSGSAMRPQLVTSDEPSSSAEAAAPAPTSPSATVKSKRPRPTTLATRPDAPTEAELSTSDVERPASELEDTAAAASAVDADEPADVSRLSESSLDSSTEPSVADRPPSALYKTTAARLERASPASLAAGDTTTSARASGVPAEDQSTGVRPRSVIIRRRPSGVLAQTSAGELLNAVAAASAGAEDASGDIGRPDDISTTSSTEPTVADRPPSALYKEIAAHLEQADAPSLAADDTTIPVAASGAPADVRPAGEELGSKAMADQFSEAGALSHATDDTMISAAASHVPARDPPAGMPAAARPAGKQFGMISPEKAALASTSLRQSRLPEPSSTDDKPLPPHLAAAAPQSSSVKPAALGAPYPKVIEGAPG
jgi:hypothetical protein